MKTKAAVVYEPGKRIEIEELDLDRPQDGEVLIRYLYAGLCHSDIHVAHGDLEARLPMVLGHEGAGIIEEVGPGVTRVKPGDHVVCSFIPNCRSWSPRRWRSPGPPVSIPTCGRAPRSAAPSTTPGWSPS
jgi:alcohol dehydrogenase (nicotinoprotein)